AERGLAAVLDGSNADDAGDWRPGMAAAAEHGVRPPLLEVGLTKREIRALSAQMGLPTWDQPAAPCLASRLPYGLAVTPARLREVERAEDAVRGLGFREFRVRHHGDAARLEIAPAELSRALELASVLAANVRAAGFARVLLDVQGYRRGALNEGLPGLRAGWAFPASPARTGRREHRRRSRGHGHGARRRASGRPACPGSRAPARGTGRDRRTRQR